MSQHDEWRIISVTDGLGLDENQQVVEIQNFQVKIVEFNEVQNFTVSKRDRDTIFTLIEEHIAFRKSLME